MPAAGGTGAGGIVEIGQVADLVPDGPSGRRGLPAPVGLVPGGDQAVEVVMLGLQVTEQFRQGGGLGIHSDTLSPAPCVGNQISLHYAGGVTTVYWLDDLGWKQDSDRNSDYL